MQCAKTIGLPQRLILKHDRADRNDGKRLQMPLRVLWGEHGLVNQCFTPIADWQEVSDGEVTGRAVACGHHIPEELPGVKSQKKQRHSFSRIR
jgi:haloacetate dehalogenase